MPIPNLGFGQSAIQGFSLGQGMAGENAFGVFVKGVMDKVNTIQAAQFEGEAKFQQEKRLLPLKTEQELAVKRGEQEYKAESAQKFLQGLQGTDGGMVPPGTKANIETPFGSIAYPMNPEVNSEEGRVIRNAPAVRLAVDKAKKLIEGTGTMTRGLSLLPAPVLPAGQAAGKFLGMPGVSQEFRRGEAMQRVTDQLKFLIGPNTFGATLSPSEQAIIQRLADPRMKSDQQATQDLDMLAQIVEYGAQLMQQGQRGLSFSQIAAEMGLDLTEFEQELGLEEDPAMMSTEELERIGSQ